MVVLVILVSNLVTQSIHRGHPLKIYKADSLTEQVATRGIAVNGINSAVNIPLRITFTMLYHISPIT